MRENNTLKIYGYDGNTPLTSETWKCVNCSHFLGLNIPCGNDSELPNKSLEPDDYCEKYIPMPDYTEKYDVVGDNILIPNNENNNELPEYNAVKVDPEQYEEFKNRFLKNANNLHDKLVTAYEEGQNYSIDDSIPNLIEVKREGNGKLYTATVQLEPTWDKYMKEIAIEKATHVLDEQIAKESIEIARQKELNSYELTEENKIQLKDTRKLIDKLLSVCENEDNIVQDKTSDVEKTLEGETKIGWFNQSTTWQRVMNAARRTIGKKPLEKEPSDSWKAKILLAEHSPIRLLEFDWGWEKIRQWVSVHLVRHHVGIEKFVHSQRSDRRELPCDRDHLYQGARNDMDMTANAQGLINMSRKRCCNCASVETREAWKLVLDELEKKDPVMRSKCVRECVYRGFCPEWMSKCGYYKTDAFKKERADYVNTLYGDDVKYYYYPSTHYFVSNTGHIYKKLVPLTDITNPVLPDHAGIVSDMSSHKLREVDYEKEWNNGCYTVKIKGYNHSVDKLVFNSFNSEGKIANDYQLLHIDGNEWNNNINNLKLIEQ